MCYIVAHIKKKPANEYDEISIGDIIIHKHATIETLESLGAIFHFIDIWN